MPEIAFLHSGFLAAGAAVAALPIVIHLLLRQRARTVEIGSVRFLRSVIRQHTRRRRIRQWMLLALRVLALLLLAALFARPFLDRSYLLGLNSEVIMLVDCSASMRTGARRDGQPLFRQAWQQMHAELTRVAQNTIVRVAVFDATGVREIPLDSLDAMPTPTDAATDYRAALAWARDVLLLSARPRRTLHIWTDLQQTGLRGRVASFPTDVRFVVHDVGREMMQNVVVEDVQATAIEIRPGRPITVAARIRNTGVLPVDAVPVTLELQGPETSLTERRTVDLPSGKRESTAFACDLKTPGLYRGEVTIDHDDDLACDNRYHLAFEVRHPDRLLLVDGQPGRTVYENETYFLEMALQLDAPTADGALRTYEIERIVWEDGEGFPDLAGFRVIVLANLRQMSDVDLRRLREYVAHGGRLLVFTGNQTAASLVAAMHQLDLAPGQLVTTPENGRLRVSTWDAEHPIFRPFADPQHGDLRRLVFRKMHVWEVLDDSACVLMYVDKRPLLIEQPLDDGKVVWMSTSVDRDWSDWPQDRLYVPMVRQLMAYLTDQMTELQTVQSKTVNRAGEQAGIEQVDGITLVRNLDSRESRLRRVSAETFAETLGLPDSDSQKQQVIESGIQAPKFAQRADEAWPLVMWILLAVLAIETLLASRVHA